MCRVMHVALVLAYVFVTIVILIVLLLVLGVCMSNVARWVMLVGWIALCAGGAFVAERLIVPILPGYRLPIQSEEDRLVALMEDVQARVGSRMRIRFLIHGDPKKPTGSIGYRTVVVQSGSLLEASDGEFQGVLAHELGHLRDGDRALEAAFVTAGLWAQVFRWGCLAVRKGFMISTMAGLLLLGVMMPLLAAASLFYLLDGVFRAIRWGLRPWLEYRQDAFACRAGFGDGLRAWLVRSGLSAHVGRIRRLEKMK
jgi:Zn-dependent protease with chaperone function